MKKLASDEVVCVTDASWPERSFVDPIVGRVIPRVQWTLVRDIRGRQAWQHPAPSGGSVGCWFVARDGRMGFFEMMCVNELEWHNLFTQVSLPSTLVHV